MRSWLVIGGAVAALACGGGGRRGQRPPREPEQTRPPTEVTSPPDAPPEAIPGDRLSVFEPNGSGCRWTAFDPVHAERSETLADFDHACTDEVWMSWNGSRSAVLVAFVDGATTEAAWRVDLLPKPQKPVRLPAAPVGRLEAVGFEGDVIRGQALPADEAVKDSTPEEGKIALTFEGTTLTADDYCCGAQLCVPLTLEGGAWKRGELQIVSHNEGTSPPWCEIPNVEKAGESGGHGEFAYKDVEIELGEGGWGLVPGHEDFAVHIEWLEGQQVSAPLAVMDDSAPAGWRFVEGFAEPGALSLVFGDEWFVACGWKTWRVYAIEGAKPIGAQHAGACPALWVTAAG